MADRRGEMPPVPLVAGSAGPKPVEAAAGTGTISWRDLEPRDHLPTLTEPFSPVTEQYRMLRRRLDDRGRETGSPLHVVAVSSALPGEGKTCTALNTAIVAAQELNRRAVMVECDLRRPRLAGLFAEPCAFGLTEVLQGTRSLTSAVRAMDQPERLSLLPAGGTPDNPVELLGSERMLNVIERLRERFDLVLLDTPPALHFADASQLGERVDGFVLVVRSGSTPRDALVRTEQILSSYGIAGVVLNGIPLSAGSRSSYYAYYGARDDER